MSTKEHHRSRSESATLEDAKAMLAAAEADADVKKRLGEPYLKKVAAHVAEAADLLAGKQTIVHAKIAEGGRVHAAAEQLLAVMRDVRDAVKLANEPPEVQAAFGVGDDWKSSSPSALAAAAHALEKAFAANPKVAGEAGIDKQHRHDLTAFADAIDEAHALHRKLANDVKDDVAARDHDLALLRADAHHIRLAAGLVHRGDPAKRAHFTSPIASHEVAHRAKKPDGAAK